MRGIVLAGGTGSRLYPLTRVTNKHILPVGRYPMIYHPLERLVEQGITDICIVTGREHMGDMVDTLGSGAEWGLDFTYKVQDGAGGIAQALGLCEKWANDEPVFVILGDNIFQKPLNAEKRSKPCAAVYLKEVADPGRFGVAYLSSEKVIKIEEKPKNPKSKMAVTGAYSYPSFVFEFIKNLKPSARGELEITDVNNAFIWAGLLDYHIVDGLWRDAGTHESLYEANIMAKDLELPRMGSNVR